MTKHQKLILNGLKKFGPCKTVTVKMKYTKEINAFIKKINDAQELTKKSKQHFP